MSKVKKSSMDYSGLQSFKVGAPIVTNKFVQNFKSGNIVVDAKYVSAEKQTEWVVFKVVNGDDVIVENLQMQSGKFTQAQLDNPTVDILINPATGARAVEGEDAIINPSMYFTAKNGVVSPS